MIGFEAMEIYTSTSDEVCIRNCIMGGQYQSVCASIAHGEERRTCRLPSAITQFFMSCRRALPVMIGNTSTVFDRFLAWRAVKVTSASGLGRKFTMQLSRSEMVRSDADDHGMDREDSVR